MTEHFPGMVIIKGTDQYCTGVYVSTHHILTTATCISMVGFQLFITMIHEGFSENKVS